MTIQGVATDDRALGSGVLIDQSRVLTSLSVAGRASALWVTFPQAGSLARHPVCGVRADGGLAVLTLATPAPREARPAPLRFPGSAAGERWEMPGGFPYGVIAAPSTDGRVGLEVSSPTGLPASAIGAGLWSPRLEAVIAVVDSESTAWPLTQSSTLAFAAALSPGTQSTASTSRRGASVPSPRRAGPEAAASADHPERTPAVRQNEDAGPAGRSWARETSAEPGRLWHPGGDGGLVEGEPSPVNGRHAAPLPYRTAWIAGARKPERVPSAGGAVTVLCGLTLGGRQFVASAAADGTVALADPATGQARHTLRTEPGQVRALVPLKLPAATCLGIVSADGSLTAWAPEQGWGQTFTVHGGRATTATCAEAGLLAVGGEDGTVEVRVLGETRPRWTATAGDGPVAALCALPGLIAMAGTDGRIRLRDAESGALRRTLDGSPRALCPVPIGGRTLLGAAGDDGLVVLWDPNTGERRHELAGHEGPVAALCPVPRQHQPGLRGAEPGRDEQTAVLASAGTDRTARLWDPRSGECRLTVPLHHEATACVAAGDHLIVGLTAGTVAYGLGF